MAFAVPSFGTRRQAPGAPTECRNRSTPSNRPDRHQQLHVAVPIHVGRQVDAGQDLKLPVRDLQRVHEARLFGERDQAVGRRGPLVPAFPSKAPSREAPDIRSRGRGSSTFRMWLGYRSSGDPFPGFPQACRYGLAYTDDRTNATERRTPIPEKLSTEA